MDQTKIVKFLTLARRMATYHVVGDTRASVFPTTEKVLGTFTQGNLTYRETSKGLREFWGKEVLEYQGKVVWTRFYKGGITEPTLTLKEVEAVLVFLRNALTHFPNSCPQERGPEKYEEGAYEYVHNFDGTFEKFKGTEEIFYKGKKVYGLIYYNC